MRYTVILTVFLGIVLSTSCGHNHQSGEMSLDNGKLWKANPETTTGINNMIKLMDGFTDKENVAAYAELNEELQVEFKLIFTNCTMTGEAHDQLHNFLVPMKGMFEGFESEDLASCQSNFDNLHTYLGEYEKFFENE